MFLQADNGVSVWYNTIKSELDFNSLSITDELLDHLMQSSALDDDSKVLIGMLADTTPRENAYTRYELWSTLESMRNGGWYEARYAVEVLDSLGLIKEIRQPLQEYVNNNLTAQPVAL